MAENWRRVALLAAPAECAAAVKADAYGLGVAAIAPALAEAGCRTFFVASFAEGAQARALLGLGPQVIVLNGLAGRGPADFAAADLTPALNTLEDLAAWDGSIPCVLHLETGMNRLAVPPEAAAACEALRRRPPILVMSHLACASEPGHSLNAAQRARFLAAASLFPQARRSLAASAGALLGPGYLFDLVRPGAALYGSWASDVEGPALAAAAQVLAPILQVKTVEAGESVGYGASWVAPGPSRLATVALGYSDGCLRALGGRGYGALGGVLCPLAGRISMDLICLDVTAAGERARPGALVEFLGPVVPLEDVARRADTIPYEILTSFGSAAARAGVRVPA